MPTDPGTPLGRLGGISFAFLDTWSHPGRVIASRCPGDAWAVGSDIQRIPEAEKWLVSSDMAPLFVMTEQGVGLLSKRYMRDTGLGLLIHFHGPRDSVARCVNHCIESMATEILYPSAPCLATETIRKYGTVREGVDDATFQTVLGSFRRLREVMDMTVDSGDDRLISPESLMSWIETVSVFIGCTVEKAVEGITTRPVGIQVYKPMLWEAWLIICMCIARAYSPERKMKYRISMTDETSGAYPYVQIQFPLMIGGQQSMAPDSEKSEKGERADTTDMYGDTGTVLSGILYMERAALWGRATVTHQLGPVYPTPLDPRLLCRRFVSDMCMLNGPNAEIGNEIKSGVKWEG